MNKQHLVPFETATQLIYEQTPQISDETISLDSSLTRVCAENIVTKETIPSFDNTAMDGYAVRRDDLKGASKENPINLRIKGITAAGDNLQQPDKLDTEATVQQTAWKVMTGAQIPSGYDSIIPVEQTSIQNDLVACFAQPSLGAHIRKAGEDFTESEPLVCENLIINCNLIMALAGQGVDKIRVRKKPKISVFSTGKELVDDANLALKPGEIRNTNKPFILNWLANYPVEVIDSGTNRDEPDLFFQQLESKVKQNFDIIISSGAVSMGDFDFIPKTVEKLGGQIIFHKSQIKPGKPILFAKFPNGTLFFGLPGNPISSTIGLRFFVATAIRKMLGLTIEKPRSARCQTYYESKPGFRNILKANASINEKSELVVDIVEGQESFKIKPLLFSNGWAIKLEQHSNIKPGEIIMFYPTHMDWV